MMHTRAAGYSFWVRFGCALLTSCTLLGCGNKGELFLAPDEQVVEELEAISEGLSDPVADEAGIAPSEIDDEFSEDAEKLQKKKQKP